MNQTDAMSPSGGDGALSAHAASESAVPVFASGRAVSQWASSLQTESVWDLLLCPTNDFESPDPSRRTNFWNAVSHRIASHPEDAGVDLYRLYPLHRALMNGAPPDVIRVLVDAYPQAVQTDNYNNDFPLHIACINEHPPEVISLLMTAHPEALHHRADGLLPLHWAAEWWRNETGTVVFDLIREGGRRQGVGGAEGLGGLRAGDKDGQTPLHYICNDVAEKGGCDHTRWSWLRALLQRAAGEALGLTRTGEEAPLPLLHAALELSCPRQFTELLLSQDSSVVVRRDCLSRTPLAIAASNDEICGEAVEALLEVGQSMGCRAARMVDSHRRLPLHRAALSGREYHDGVKAILEAAPRALSTRDVESRMYPFMLAAVVADKDGYYDSSIDSIFELLKADPTLILDRTQLSASSPRERKWQQWTTIGRSHDERIEEGENMELG